MKLSAPEISTCSTCGAALEETANGDLGCMVCLLRVGLSGEDQVGEDLPVVTDDRFGIYVIERHDDGSFRELGRGAMGVTFCAIDTSLQRKVALKIIKTDLAARSAEARERFMREARAAAALRHENVATVYQFGIREETGQCFYAMELIEGETLEERVRRTGPLDARTIIAIGQQVTAALSAAEKRGLVHRDLKPANLMLISPDDEPTSTNRKREIRKLVVKIIDFGLAKALKHETDPMTLTRDGFVGTPAFASPEQFGNAPLDVRSDIYSLGLTLWFGLTGKTPFSGRSVEEIRSAQQSGELSIHQLKAARVSFRLIALLQSMLAIEPAARPGADALVTRLQSCAASVNSTRNRLVFALATALTFLLATIAWLASRPSPKHESGGTSNPKAHEAYLKGTYIWDKRDYPQYAQAEQYFRHAIALDSHYAQAYALLGDVLQFQGADRQRRDQFYAESEAATRKALELNPDLAEAHDSLGLVAMNYQWDWPMAEKEFRRAIVLNPDYPTGHHWYGEFLATQTKFEESLREIQRAHQLAPALTVILSDEGKILVFARRYEQAKMPLQETLKLDPAAWGARFWLAFADAQTKQFPEAFAELEKMEQLAPTPWTSGLAAYVYGLAGERAKAEQMLAETQKRLTPQDDYLSLVYAYFGVGDKERALFYLERECENHGVAMTSLRVAPVYDPLRSDPRFVDLLRRVHLDR